MPRNSPLRIQFSVRGWAAIAVAIGMLAAIVFLAVGFLVFVLPVLLAASIMFWLFPKARFTRVGNPPAEPPARNAGTIEGDFRVIDGTPNDNMKPADFLSHDD